MKTIGLIGGMSWESTAEYYRLLNMGVQGRLGGTHSAKIILYSFDFEEVERLQHDEDWSGLAVAMIEAGRILETAGAELLLLCTNTMHAVYDKLNGETGVPVIHIADAAAVQLKKSNPETVGLIGTRFTMESSFYRDKLENDYGFRVLTPDEADRRFLHRTIYGELCRGIFAESSRTELIKVVKRLRERGSDAIILGCTELPLLIRNADLELPLIDTTLAHVEAALEAAFSFDSAASATKS